MIKGTQKNIIFLKNTGSEFFDEAYFILSHSARSKRNEDIVAEASRIIADASKDDCRKNTKGRSLLLFSLGVVFGALCSVAICLAII